MSVAETENLNEYFSRLIPAYCNGISQYIDIPPLMKKLVWEMMLIKFGYRMVQEYLFTSSDEVKKGSVDRLQKIYEMRDM
jgi:hypothetical protein